VRLFLIMLKSNPNAQGTFERPADAGNTQFTGYARLCQFTTMIRILFFVLLVFRFGTALAVAAAYNFAAFAS
jgi:hypothetical protein